MTDARKLKGYRVEVPIRAGRDEVWKAVTQPSVLLRWFGWDYQGLEAEIQQIFVDQAARLDAHRMGWADGSYLEVSGDKQNSTVRAIREGPAADTDRFDAIEEGWKAFLAQLRFLLEHRPTGQRRTIYLTGDATGRETLALVEAEWERVGSRVAWVVDPDDHLVVAAGKAPFTRRSATATQVIVSTYGLAEEEFATCRDEWAKRWTAVAAGARVTVAGSPDPTGTPDRTG